MDYPHLADVGPRERRLSATLYAMNYSLLRSKTFWTIVVMAVVGAGNAIVPVLPADIASIIQVVLALLASYFHLQTATTFGATN